MIELDRSRTLNGPIRRRTLFAVGGAALLVLALARTPAQAQNPFALDLPAPDLVGGPWLNTPHGAPIKLADRKGKVTVVEFWTFG